MYAWIIYRMQYGFGTYMTRNHHFSMKTPNVRNATYQFPRIMQETTSDETKTPLYLKIMQGMKLRHARKSVRLYAQTIAKNYLTKPTKL